MIVAPGLQNPTATCEAPYAPGPDGEVVEPRINNHFRIDVAALTVASRNRASMLSSAQQAHVEEMELELSVLGSGEGGTPRALYLAPSGQCQVVPDAPYKESILTTGVQDAVMDRVEQLRSDGTRSATELRDRFQDKMKLFSTWKRVHTMVPQHQPDCLFQVSSASMDADVTAPPSPHRPLSPTGRNTAFDSVGTGAGADGAVHLRRELVHRPRCLPLHVDYQPYAPNFRASGLLDDSYFIAAVACIATNRRLLASVFVSLEHLARGAATLQFYPTPHREGGEAQFVTIDTLVPVTSQTHANAAPKDMKLLFGATSEPQDTWLALLEKAYATFRGSYAALDGGCAIQALVHLTGGSPWSLTLQGGLNAAPTPLDDVWWFLMQGTLHGDVMLAYSLPPDAQAAPADGGACVGGDSAIVAPATYPTLGVPWHASLVVVFACEYDSTVEVPQDLYAKLLGKPTKRGDVYRLVKVRQASRQRREEGKWSWDWSSPKWTTLAKQHLAVGDVDGNPETAPDSLSWWVTVEELAAHFTTLTACTNYPHSCVQTDIGIMTPAPSVEEIALHAPVFSLDIVRKANAKDPQPLSRRASYHVKESLPHEFQSIHDVQIPDLDFGPESEDEDDDATRGVSPMGSSSPRSAMSGSQTFLDSIRSRNAVALEVRVAVPLHMRHKTLQVVLYRVAARGKKVDCTTTVRDGKVVYQLPIHGRLPWSRYASPPSAGVVSAPSAEQPVSDGFFSLHTSCSYFAEADVLEGFYNIVVIVDPTTTQNGASSGEPLNSVAGPVLLSVRQRPSPGGATTFDLHMCVLRPVELR